MLSQNTNALGIIFPNSYDNSIPEMVTERAMASIPFAGRYRMIDFPLSSMANCGITNVSVIVRKNYHSLMDHLGAGREWDLSRRRGGLTMWPPFADKNVKLYNGRVEAIASILNYLESQREKYVIMSDTNLAANIDYNSMLAEHQKSGADITMLYRRTEIPAGLRDDNSTVSIGEGGRVKEFLFNDYRPGLQNLSMNVYAIDRLTLIKLIKDATSRGIISFEREILAHNVDVLNIHAMEYTGYVACVCNMKSFFDENRKLIDDRNLDALFPATSPVYTKTRDDNPTRYVTGSHVANSLIADGCCIEGSVENCVLFRGVVVKKGAVVKDCVLMQDTVVEPDVQLNCVVTDKNVRITAGKCLSGTESFPVYVAKRHTV
jgi:glucose-1-phosphate adenylyltransferase